MFILFTNPDNVFPGPISINVSKPWLIIFSIPIENLTGFIKRINTDKKINILNIGDIESYEKTLEFLKINN